MQRHRVLLAFGIAWFTALVLSWAVYKKTAAPQKRDVVQAVAAAKNVAVGKLIESADLKLVTLDRKDRPDTAFSAIADVAGRAAVAPLSASELVLEAKLAHKGGGDSMTALIEPGMRAVSVQVNEISGVSGFIQPGTRVDVLFTRIFSNGDAAATTILQNVKVIAYGRQLEADTHAKVADVRDAMKNTVATLLVTGEDAEKLALAIQRGRIQLALRNPLDNQVDDEQYLVRSADLGIEEPARPGSQRPATPPRAEAKKPSLPNGAIDHRGDGSGAGQVVRVFRGSKMSEEVF